MLTTEDIVYLANLARIAVREDDLATLAKDLSPVLSYVSEVSSIQDVSAHGTILDPHRNVMRDDVDPYPGGTFTTQIVSNMPHVEDGYLKVPRIL